MIKTLHLFIGKLFKYINFPFYFSFLWKQWIIYLGIFLYMFYKIRYYFAYYLYYLYFYYQIIKYIYWIRNILNRSIKCCLISLLRKTAYRLLLCWKKGSRYTTPRKISHGTFHPEIFHPGMFPPDVVPVCSSLRSR